MMTNILHKLLSTGTVEVRVDMEEVLLEAPEGSRVCMANRIKGMEPPHRRAMTSIQPLQQTQVPLHSSTRHLVETALLQEVSVIMAVRGPRNHPRPLSNIPALVLATIVPCLMCLGVLSRISRGRTRGLVPTWVNRVVTRTRFAIIVTRPKDLVVQALRWASPEDVPDLLQMGQVRQHCHSRKDKVQVRASKVTVDIWAIRCMVSRVHISVEARAGWAADTTNLEVKIIRRAATGLTVLVMGRVSMGTAIAVDGGPTMGTKF